jgi:hypothetical protein
MRSSPTTECGRLLRCAVRCCCSVDTPRVAHQKLVHRPALPEKLEPVKTDLTEHSRLLRGGSVEGPPVTCVPTEGGYRG